MRQQGVRDEGRKERQVFEEGGGKTSEVILQRVGLRKPVSRLSKIPAPRPGTKAHGD